MAETSNDAVVVFAEESVAVLLERAAQGDSDCRPQLRTLLLSPDKRYLLEHYGNPPTWLKDQLIENLAGNNQAAQVAIAIRLDEVRTALEGSNPTPIERLLAERAAFCWLLVNDFEHDLARAHDLTFRQAEYHQRRIDGAHKRFLSAIKTLATIRKLALPALQVNIGKNQVNVAGG